LTVQSVPPPVSLAVGGLGPRREHRAVDADERDADLVVVADELAVEVVEVARPQARRHRAAEAPVRERAPHADVEERLAGRPARQVLAHVRLHAAGAVVLEEFAVAEVDLVRGRERAVGGDHRAGAVQREDALQLREPLGHALERFVQPRFVGEEVGGGAVAEQVERAADQRDVGLEDLLRVLLRDPRDALDGEPRALDVDAVQVRRRRDEHDERQHRGEPPCGAEPPQRADRLARVGGGARRRLAGVRHPWGAGARARQSS
jgi:hypothetical protein